MLRKCPELSCGSRWATRALRYAPTKEDRLNHAEALLSLAGTGRLLHNRSQLHHHLDSQRPMLISTINLQHAALYMTNAMVRDVTNDADQWVADGFPLVSAFRRIGLDVHRVTGSGLAASLLRSDVLHRCKRVVVLGSTPSVIGAYAVALRRAGRELVFQETRPVAQWDLLCIRHEIRGADIVLVALGVEAGALVAASLRPALTCPLVVVGAGIGMAVGAEQRAPAVLQSMRAEWVWRLARDPNRMWRRYVYTCIPAQVTLWRATRLSRRAARRGYRACG